MLKEALLYARTARHLRLRQLVFRPVRRLRRAFGTPPTPHGWQLADVQRLDALRAALLKLEPVDRCAVIERANAVCAGRFVFQSVECVFTDVEWSTRHVSHLWSYHLHYFEAARDLAWAYHFTAESAYVRRIESLALSWIAATEGRIGDGWDSYPLSLRIVNWSYALLLTGSEIDPVVRQRLVESMAEQTEHLSHRLEWDLLGNHLLKNLCALATVAPLFTGPPASRWRGLAAHHLPGQIAEQVLSDGGHVERSPMYHCIALGDLLQLTALLDAVKDPLCDAVRNAARRMADAYVHLVRPGGALHLLNDSASDLAPSDADLRRAMAAVLGAVPASPSGQWSMPASAFYGYVDSGRSANCIIDAGAPMPEYQPGHAHCGLLSFELDLNGVPFVVDSGLCGYAGDPLREYVRSTRAHNTVAIDGFEQSEFWADFRVARRAKVRHAALLPSGEPFHFVGAYSPFHDREAVHTREIRTDGHSWWVEDCVAGARGARLTSFLHLHPQWTVDISGGRVVARNGVQSVAIDFVGIDGLRLLCGERAPAQGWYCPEFGRPQAAMCIETSVLHNRGARFGFCITPVIAAP